MPKSILRLLLVLVFTPMSAIATVIGFSASNALRDNNLDDTPDELAWYASNYVYHAIGESRTFAEFDLRALPAITSASVQFDVRRYNSGAMQLQVYGYLGNGSVELSDWHAAGSLLSSLSIDPYVDRGDLLAFSVDVTGALSAAQAAGASYFSLYFRDPTRATDFNEGLLTVGNFSIATPGIAAPAAVPEAAATAGLLLAALAGCVALPRRRQS